MPFPIPISFEAITEWIFGNILYVVLFGAGLFFILNFLKFGRKKTLKPVNIADIERMKFIERMKPNKTDYKWFFRGKDLIGKIVAKRELPPIEIKSNPSKEELTQILVRPMLIGKLGISNPLAKLMPFQLDAKTVRMDMNTKSIDVPQYTTFDYFMGIYYDNALKEEIHKNIILDHNLYRATAQQLASTFFSKSQEQSTFDPEHAHQLALKEKELQIELAKKRGKMTTI